MNKKNYIRPAFKIVKLNQNAPLLGASETTAPPIHWSEDEDFE